MPHLGGPIVIVADGVEVVVLGGEVIRGFSFGMIWGVLIGTYSSICLAVPLLLYLNVDRGTDMSTARTAQEPAE